MSRKLLSLLAASALLGLGGAQNGTEEIKLGWIGSTPAYQHGTTFGVPWPRGKYQSGKTAFTVTGSGGEQINLQSWENALWPDNSIKWTGHAIPASENASIGYTLKTSTSGGSPAGKLTIKTFNDEYLVNTGKISVSFARKGNTLVRSIKTATGKVVGQNGRLILTSQGPPSDEDDYRRHSSQSYYQFQSQIEEVTVSANSSVRALVTIRGNHETTGSGKHAAWLPFIVRFYLYENSEAIKIVHTIVFDGKAQDDFITGLGLTFDVPLKGEELFNRHVRIAGVDGGLLSEAVQGITGLRRDPGLAVKFAQFEGQTTPDKSTWDVRVSKRLQWIPPWNDYSLDQLSPDGFTLKKRTKKGQSWVNIPGATRAGGLAYLGGGTEGGLAIAQRDFWKKYPTGLDISDAATDTGKLTLWLYSPSAPPLDLRPYHDGLGLDGNYTAQLDALEITYEDYEEGFNTPYGVGRTNEVFLYAFDKTPSRQKLSALIGSSNMPPVLAPKPEYLQKSKAAGSYWAVPGSSAAASIIESNLNFLFKFYEKQVLSKRWFGFFDYGDVNHSYDADRHTWRYDIGGYAWDNSELSPDIFVWLQFLRTGREDVYRFAEALARHGSEVDIYHLGKWKGLGSRHNVQHWGDSAKQVRISTPQYRKVFYYISGGDERIGEIIQESALAIDTFQVLDGRRKVRMDGYKPTLTAIDFALGTDWSALAAGWLLEWERRGPNWEQARAKLNATVYGIGKLKNGFVTGAALFNPTTFALTPPLNDPDNKGLVDVSHLSSVFGLAEVISELIDHWGPTIPKTFESAWYDYAYYYGVSGDEQTARYGKAFGTPTLRQGHSRLTAYIANRYDNATLAARAWKEFTTTDGMKPGAPWSSVLLNGSEVLVATEEATWINTNDFGLYGAAAIENLALVGGALA